MDVRFSKQFAKNHKKTDKKIKIAWKKRLGIFLQDPFSPILDNHLLTGIYRGCRSIDITGDWRAIYYQNESVIYFVAIGTHSQLYK